MKQSLFGFEVKDDEEICEETLAELSNGKGDDEDD